MDAARIGAASVQIPDLRTEEFNLQIPLGTGQTDAALAGVPRARHHGLRCAETDCRLGRRGWGQDTKVFILSVVS